jgi:Holliday junction resolvase RusA-like endonuclease
MAFDIEIPDGFFTDDEKNKLMRLLNANNDNDFSEALGKIILASLDEYKEMFLGMGLPSRASEIREYRLYHLIKRFFNGRIPNELEVSSMFQLPESRSKNLILYVLTRFRYDLETDIQNTLKDIINDATQLNDDNEFRVYIESKNMVEEFNRIIARAGGRNRRLARIQGESNMYCITSDSFKIIVDSLNT